MNINKRGVTQSHPQLKSFLTGLLPFLLFFCFSLDLQAQKQTTEGSNIFMIARAKQPVIHLRWAPAKPLLWKYANTYGYTLERYTITRSGKMLAKPEYKLMARSLKPRPLKDWEQLADSSDYAAIVAQALYGGSFNTELEGSSQLASIVNRSNELEQRFSFSLFACDHEFTAARFAALGYSDSAARPEEQYLYRIFANVPSSKMKSDTAYVYAGLKDEQPLPRPLDMGAVFNDRTALLSWDFSLLGETYNSYIVERSEEGKTFEPLMKHPLVTTARDSSMPSRMYYADSLSANGIVYSYRVRGIDAFGEVGPPSDTVSGQGRPSLTFNPSIEKFEIISARSLQLSWNFPAEGNELITGFHIIRAGKINTPCDTLLYNIPPSQREVLLNDSLLSSNYISVIAVGRNGTRVSSFPVLVQPEDHQPPAPPESVRGTMDVEGKVTLHWKRNKESDFMGYRIFRSNTAEGEFVQVTVSPKADTFFHEKVPVNTIHKKIYYKLLAVDQRYNASAFSPVIEIKKPSRTAPSIPAISRYELNGGLMKLEWINSPDQDVAKHQVLRRMKIDDAHQPVHDGWMVVKELQRTGNERDSITDELPVADHRYQYSVRAVNEAGFVSAPAQPVTVKMMRSASSLPRPELSAKPDRDEKHISLAWKFDAGGVAQYWLYRAEGSGPLSLLQTVNGSETKFTDTGLKVNTRYRYSIKAILTNGQQSRFSEPESIMY